MPATKYAFKDLTFGCEIEGFYPAENQQKIVRLANKYACLKGNRGTDGSVLGSDESIGDYDTSTHKSAEIRTRPYAFGQLKELKEFHALVEGLKRLGFQTNSTCGGHVHIGIGNYLGKMDTPAKMAFLTRLALNMSNIEDAIYVFNGGDKRRDGAYAHKLPMDQFGNDMMFAGSFRGFERYCGLNFTALGRTAKTIEFRLFQGSVNADSWINNVLLAGKFTQKTAMGIDMPKFDKKNAKELIKYFDLNEKAFEEYRERIRSKQLSDAIKPLRNKSKVYDIRMVKMWKAVVKTLKTAYPQDSQRENAYLHLRKVFANSVSCIVYPNGAYFQKPDGKGITHIEFGSSRVFIYNVPESREYRDQHLGFGTYIPTAQIFEGIT